MARFLFSVWPAPGHLYPSLPIAHALRAAGHTVAYVTLPAFEPLLAAHTMAYFPLDHAPIDVFEAPLTDDANSRDKFKANFRQSFIVPIPAHVRSLQAASAAWHPDVLVNDYVSYGGLLAGEIANLPVATLVMTIFSWPSDDMAPFGHGLPPARDPVMRARYAALRARADAFFADVVAELNDARVAFGLPLRTGPLPVATLSPDLVLLLGIPEFDYARADLPPQAYYVGPCAWEPQAQLDADTAAWLDALPPEMPLVLVTASTATREVDRRSALLVEMAMGGLAGTGLAVLATLPFDHPLHEMTHSPYTRLVRFVAHSYIMPRTALIVTHGGFGTVMKALSYGRPLVVAPFTGDQPEVAQRVVEAGVGLRLATTALTPATLREAVVATLGESRYRNAAQRLATLLAHRNGPVEAAAHLIRLAADNDETVHHDANLEVRP